MSRTEQSENLAPFLVDIAEAARLLSTGKSLLYSMAADGRLGPRPVQGFGRKRLYSTQELADWIRAGCPAREKWQRIRAERGEK